jgi:hypothetical protein
LQEQYAVLTVETGRWELFDNDGQNFVWRVDDVIYRVFQRLQEIDGAVLTGVPLALLAGSNTAINGYRERIVAPLRQEVVQHVKYVKGVRDRALRKLQASWNWYVGITIIGYIFLWIARNAEAKLQSRFEPLLQKLKKQYIDLKVCEKRIKKIMHISGIIQNSAWIGGACVQASQYQAELALIQAKVNRIAHRMQGSNTFYLMRRDSKEPERLILSKLNSEPTTAQVEHVPVMPVIKKNNRFVYRVPNSIQGPGAGDMIAGDLGALATHLQSLVGIFGIVVDQQEG